MDGDGNFDGFSAMGFDVMHNFEEVSCDAATWTMIPPAWLGWLFPSEAEGAGYFVQSFLGRRLGIF